MRTAGTKSTLTVTAGVMLAAVLLLGGCGGGESEAVVDVRVPVLVESVSRDDLKVVRTYTGSVEGIRQATLYARIPETVTKIHADEGDNVRAGDVVVSFDEGGPTSMLRQARVVWEDAKKTAEKFERLYQQGAVSEIEYDSRKAAADVAHADFESAREQARLTSSISGVLTDLYTRVGERESAGNPVALIAAVDTVRLMLELMRHLYVSGGDPRFTERMPASPGVLDEMLSDIHYLAKNHRRQETVLKKLEIISIEEAGGGRLDIRTRELWQINILWLTGDEVAEPPSVQLIHGRYLVSSGNQGWRVDAWELTGPVTDRS